jgi:hypothetical protein
MKNILTILEEQKVPLSEEQKEAINKEVTANYKTIAEVEKKDEKIKALTEKVGTYEESLKKFEGVDTEGLKKQITDLNEKLATKDKEYTQKLADRDFNDILKDSIATAKGKNATAITALLDLDALKASKNQKEDIKAALDNLAKSDAYLFDTQTEQKGKPPIGKTAFGANGGDDLPDRYKGNPFYHA